MESWRIPQADIEALRAARHGDPFAWLGPHPAPGGLAVRAFVPHAVRLSVLPADGGGAVALERRDEAGIFEGFLPGRALPFAYRLRAENEGGLWEVEDPFRFGPTLGPLDDHLMVEGTHRRLHERLGAHVVRHEGASGTRFAVWAPNAQRVSVVGDFNEWDGRRHPMRKRVDSGLWEVFIPGLGAGTAYKYEILGIDGTLQPLKSDPFGRGAQLRPGTASVIVDEPVFPWEDAAFLAQRAARQSPRAPISVYEVHAPSWRRHPDGRFYSWDDLVVALVPYVAWMGFTHIELMPVMEHPLDESWGYQPIGLHAPTARLGDAEGLKRFILACHQHDLGVILDWVPAHFPQDRHGLIRFDGATLYEHPDPKRGFHKGWGTATFDFGRREVAGFLASNALYWLQEFHADGLRVDAVSTMVHLDHGRAPDDWTPNEEGGTENHEAVAFLRQVNALVAEEAPGAAMFAEEATSWPGVTRAAVEGGLGFQFKWNMGWMNDTLRYVAMDPLHRRWHHNLITFGMMYAFSENFVLPLSHDEVVHGKGSLLGRLPGDDWQRFATLRAYFGMMWGHPGKKLLFMGGEIGQWREWSEARELDWWLLQFPPHQGVHGLVRELNKLFRTLPALHARDAEQEGFQWIDADDAENSVFSWLRRDGAAGPPVAVLCNLTPVPRLHHRFGLPRAGVWREVLNTDATAFGGSGMGNMGRVVAEKLPLHGQKASAQVVLPPLATIYLMLDENDQEDEGDDHAEQP
ncbi:1,4-alpha-glucan branching protein GlgB [Roseomonas sp. BU-1]|uniref:1,4-alpha-glucan branching enzyme GlgB n=1 Tax=Falsiroseomonas selenitidurans TaxID=2716335 RepID=A0ABX1E185_9PROT|nr:1,4-alpha-glucan branching protein GlgB [Falsiroseomonas selenitidurans]